MDIVTFAAEGSDAGEALKSQLIELPEQPAFIAIQCNADCDMSALRSYCRDQDIAVHGTSSCLGSFTEHGATNGAVVFAVMDEDGDYGASAMPSAPQNGGQSPMRLTAAQAAQAALKQADRPGEAPVLVWLTATPGDEEAVLDGIADIVGPDVPVIGGSAADNTVSGDWFIFDAQEQFGSGVVVSVLFPTGPVTFAYQNGYAPTEHSGTVTKADGRVLIEIDDRPAAEVYAEWTAGAVPWSPGAEPRGILSDSTLWPLGRQNGDLSGMPSFLLAHPAEVSADGSLALFASVPEGDTLTQMNGSADSLVARAGRVANLARTTGRFDRHEVAGALMVYCGGCMLSVQDRIEEVVDGVVAELPGAPLAGVFTFGEQGPIVGAGNRHGNLMISCVVFGKSEY